MAEPPQPKKAKKQPRIGREKFGIRRKLNKDGTGWERFLDNSIQRGAAAKGVKVDAYHDLYARTAGFANVEEDAAGGPADPRYEDCDQVAEQVDALTRSTKHVEMLSVVEGFFLELGTPPGGTDGPYVTYLKELVDRCENPKKYEGKAKLAFMSCPPQALRFMCKVMYDNQGKKGPLIPGVEPRWITYNSVRTRLGDINGANRFYGGVNAPTCSSSKLTRFLLVWKAKDDETNAASFPMESLKFCYAGLSSLKWAKIEIIKYWSMLLVALVICARTSCIVTYMPKMCDIRLPQAHNWDPDGTPKFIEIGLRNWKWRKKNKGERYGIILWRNYVDSRFCPVFWLMLWLNYGEPAADGGIWSGVTEDKYRKHILKILEKTGVKDTKKKKLRAHSLRVVGAQWAGRCGDKGMGAKQAGRWADMNMVAHYIAKGAKTAGEFANAPEKDPIFKMWRWKPVTTGNESSDDEL